MKLVINSGQGADNGQEAYLNGHSASWPDDFRFADVSDNVLPYWIESFDADTATVWVKINDIAAWPETTTLKIYYGKADDPGASSGPDTFIMFEDFSDDARRTTVWSESKCDAIAGYPDIHAFENGGYHIRQSSPRDTGAWIILASPLDEATWCTVTLQDVSEQGKRSPPWILTRVGFNTTDWGFGYWSHTYGDYDTLPGHTYQIVWTDGRTKNNMLLYENGVQLITTGSYAYTSHRPAIGVRTASDAWGEWYFRDFYARAYTANPPAHGNWGGEGPEVTQAPAGTPKPASTPKPTATPRVVDAPGTALIPVALCGGCICGGGGLFLLVLLIVVVFDEKRNR